MANDYVFIHCKECKERKRIASYYPGFVELRTGGTYVSAQDFLKEHINCHPLVAEHNTSLGDSMHIEFLNETQAGERGLL